MTPTGSIIRLAAAALLALSMSVAFSAPGVLSRSDTDLAPGSEYSQLLDLLRGAAEGGDIEAMNQLGVLYVANARAATDHAMAHYWFQRAIDNGSASAMFNLARMYLYAIGVPRDYPNAFVWFKRSAEGGNSHAMYTVALMAEVGLGTDQDPALARSSYRQAAAAGIVQAMVWVGEDLLSVDVGRAQIDAYAWLQAAALSELDERLQLHVFARMAELERRLGPLERDEARASAARLVAAIPRAAGNSGDGAPRPSSPRRSGQVLPIVAGQPLGL